MEKKSILAKVKGIAMIDRVYNKKNKTNESGKNSLSDLSLSVFSAYAGTVNDSTIFPDFERWIYV